LCVVQFLGTHSNDVLFRDFITAFIRLIQHTTNPQTRRIGRDIERPIEVRKAQKRSMCDGVADELERLDELRSPDHITLGTFHSFQCCCDIGKVTDMLAYKGNEAEE
jgi:hypothetical protein